jgi:hypothetical protein
MSKSVILIVRLVTSVVIALFISFFFFQKKSVVLVAGLALVLFGLAYIFEFARKRNEDE